MFVRFRLRLVPLNCRLMDVQQLVNASPSANTKHGTAWLPLFAAVPFMFARALMPFWETPFSPCTARMLLTWVQILGHLIFNLNLSRHTGLTNRLSDTDLHWNWILSSVAREAWTC